MQRMIALVLSLSLSGSGCSFVMTKGPGDVGNPPTVFADCSESKAGPVVDIIVAGVLGVSALGGLGVLAGNDTSSSHEKLGTTATVAAVVGALGFGAGAFYGFTRVSQCKSSHAAYALAHPAPVVQQVAYYPPPGAAPIGSSGGFCTPQNTCDVGLICAGMPDRTNKCMPGQPQPLVLVGGQGGACTPQLTCNQGLVCAGMPDRTTKCMAALPVVAPPGPPAIGMRGGACTAQLTCSIGLSCAGMADRTNKCIPSPPPGAQGGACMANNACNTGLACAGMPDHTNKCMPSR